MIPFNFTYYRPDSLEEAITAYQEQSSQGKKAVYYGGGSEIITMCRTGSIQPDAVIDIKKISECREIRIDENTLYIGGACTLSNINESKLFPLLGTAGGRIADHTNQCRITLGGNLCGTIIYRETSLPLLLCDAEITLYGPQGYRRTAFQNVFQKRMQLASGECVVQVHIPKWALTARYFHIKRTTNEKIDYPLVNVTALCKDNFLRLAFSGVCSYPFRSQSMENTLNDTSLPLDIRIEKALHLLPEPAYHDVEGSGEYRIFVLKNTLYSLLNEWESTKS